MAGCCFGPSALGPAARLAVLAALLVAVLASTAAWPVLVYSGFNRGGVLYANLIGKWIYFGAAVITIVGLCVMIARVVGVLSASHRRSLALGRMVGVPAAGIAEATEGLCRSWRWIWRAGGSAAAAAVTLGRHRPATWSADSQFRSAHAEGLVPAGPDLLLGPLPRAAAAAQLAAARAGDLRSPVDLTRAAAGRRGLAAGAGPGKGARERVAERAVTSRVAARRLAIPVMMLILFSAYTYYYSPWAVTNYTWLYVPVTPLCGLAILAWVLPARQAKADRTRSPKEAIRLTLRAWRTAEFADSQRQQLLGNADDLRKSLVETGAQAHPEADGRRTYEALANAQNELSEKTRRLASQRPRAPAGGIRPPG